MKWALMLSMLYCYRAEASYQIKTQIHEIDYGAREDDVLLLLTSGQVLHLSKEKNKTLLELAQLQKAHHWLEMTLTAQNEIETFAVTTPAQKPNTKQHLGLLEPYAPTIVENQDVLTNYFHQAKYVNKESQCYNRAHIWAYEWFTKNAINSNKTWLFFTRKYIRKFKFDWWFHVSPSLKVLDAGEIKEKIMDVKYGRSPLSLKAWTDIFMRDDFNCPMVKTYSDYANYPETGSCYTLRTSMYLYQPVDIERNEIWGTSKTNWYNSEVEQAYLEAFDEVL